MAEFLGRDIHEQVVHLRVFLPQHERLGEVLQRGGEFAVGSAELLHQQLANLGSGSADPYLELKILIVNKHRRLRAVGGCKSSPNTRQQWHQTTGDTKEIVVA